MTQPPPLDANPMRYILRVDDGHYAWKVSIRRANQYLHKYFADREHGGMAHALAAAMAYRDELVTQTTDADYEIWKRELPRSTNTSGVTGVARYLRRVSKSGSRREYALWQGFYKDLDGKRQIKAFSESLHGRQGAYERALQFRREGLERVRLEAHQRQESIS